jgi:hypothetical protein
MHATDDLLEALSTGKRGSRPGDEDGPLNAPVNLQDAETAGTTAHYPEQTETGLGRLAD